MVMPICLLGNRGENFYFTADESRPAKLWVNDYDKNGTVEKIITQTINGKDMPVPMKKRINRPVDYFEKAKSETRRICAEEYSRVV